MAANDTVTFELALERWHVAEKDSCVARLEYERAYAQAIIHSKGSNAESRKSDADLVCFSLYETYQLRAIEARAAEHLMMHLRGDVRAWRGAHAA